MVSLSEPFPRRVGLPARFDGAAHPRRDDLQHLETDTPGRTQAIPVCRHLLGGPPLHQRLLHHYVQ